MAISQSDIDAVLAGVAAQAGAAFEAFGVPAAQEAQPTPVVPDPPTGGESPPAAPGGRSSSSVASRVPVAAGVRRPRKGDVERVVRLGVTLVVTLAERDMPIESVLKTTVGSIIEFDQAFDAELALSVGNCPIGVGQAVKVGENFGLRITRVGTVEERIQAMGPRA
ncbi:MAG TPA: FliM/FliN family flagellar motor C-terminal domain-containing protein [Phycisphaerae bacterium]|nr:FliM/FliN family flagellar motor C-terminal domain-containing protein [Phycisphaerae bacterium]HNU44581.1 FliM/FliN family flagellar motor C-terminal domain-containing protein [Phycisphaerae bacterium]